ncbi:hypothetical protein GS682_15000 [Nostoc sp. B(2019)]|nr:hypothetical protein [Nostoc sp. B(2019)]
MKFSVKSIYPISTTLRATNCRAGWESAVVEVEYLFMGDGSRNHGQITEGNNDFRYLSIGVLNAKLQLDEGSGRYRHRNTVPI